MSTQTITVQIKIKHSPGEGPPGLQSAARRVCQRPETSQL